MTTELPLISARFTIRAGEQLPISLNWIHWLSGTHITNAEWEAAPAPPPLDPLDPIPAPLNLTNTQHNLTTSTVWLSGGEAGHDYKLQATITNNIGATYKANVTVKVVP